MTTSALLRPRSTVEIVDAAIRLCGLHYPTFAATTAVILIGAAQSVLGVGERALNVAMDVAFVLAYPVLSVVATLLYYDLRIRKEGFDLTMIARELGEVEDSVGDARASTEAP
jgi:uncharacterized membrane protein